MCMMMNTCVRYSYTYYYLKNKGRHLGSSHHRLCIHDHNSILEVSPCNHYQCSNL